VRSHVLAVGLYSRHSMRSRFGTQGRLVEVDNKDFRVRVNDDLPLPETHHVLAAGSVLASTRNLRLESVVLFGRDQVARANHQ
jgi:hypothetical protein